MQMAIIVNPNDSADLQRGLSALQSLLDNLGGETDAAHQSLVDVLALDSSRLVRLAHAHFGCGRFDLNRLAAASGEDIRVLHGMTGSLGRACDNRNVQVFDRHGGTPLVMSVRTPVADLLAAEALASDQTN